MGRYSLTRVQALIVKEFFQMIRDPSSILISVVLPLILLFIYGFGVSLDTDHIRIGLVMEDTSPAARSFASSLTNSRYFDVMMARDRRDVEKKIIEGKIRGIVVIPSYFSQFRDRKDHTAPIQVITDGSEPNTANFVQNYVAGALQSWLKQEAVSSDLKGLPLVSSQPRIWYNEQLESRNFLIPGSIAIIMALIGTLLTALVVAREWERGTMEALMSTPVKINEILIGKLVPYFILAMLAMSFCAAVAIYVYDVPFRGSFFALVILSSVFVFDSLGLGLLISASARNQFVASQGAMVAAFLPAFILSGFIFEIASMPLPIQLLTYVLPARYFVSALQTIFLVGDIWELFYVNIAAMLLIGLFFFAMAVRKTVKRLD